MIQQKIAKDITEEFINLQSELKIHLRTDFDIDVQKEFLLTHISKEVIYKSKLLLDTLLNYLMDQAINNLENESIELQNKFFDQDFRKRIEQWATETENRLILNPAKIEFSNDPRRKQGIIASGASFVAGAATSGIIASQAKTVSAVAEKTIITWNPYLITGAIATGLATLIVSAVAFKAAYYAAAPKSRELVKTDIDQYLRTSEQQIRDWLESVLFAFSKDFNAFCSANGVKPEGIIQ